MYVKNHLFEITLTALMFAMIAIYIYGVVKAEDNEDRVMAVEVIIPVHTAAIISMQKMIETNYAQLSRQIETGDAGLNEQLKHTQGLIQVLLDRKR